MVMLKLVETHCIPILTYGIEVINVANRDERRQLGVAYNSVFRKIFQYRLSESVTALQAFLGQQTWEGLVDDRRSRFVNGLLHCSEVTLAHYLLLWCFFSSCIWISELSIFMYVNYTICAWIQTFHWGSGEPNIVGPATFHHQLANVQEKGSLTSYDAIFSRRHDPSYVVWNKNNDKVRHCRQFMYKYLKVFEFYL